MQQPNTQDKSQELPEGLGPYSKYLGKGDEWIKIEKLKSKIADESEFAAQIIEQTVFGKDGFVKKHKKKQAQIPGPAKFLENISKKIEQSNIDALTGLWNRRGLAKARKFFEHREAKGFEKSLSIISLDIDFFKAYNLISHKFGDLTLQSVGHVLLDYAKKDKSLNVRLGGEEILLVFQEDLSADEIKQKAEEIRQRVNELLLDLFSYIDEQREPAQPGATQDTLEYNILTEPRNRTGFNQEKSKSQAYQNAKAEIVKAAKADPENELLNELAEQVSSDSELEPAEFAIKLKQLISQASGKEKDKLIQIKEQVLGFKIGTLTAGEVIIHYKDSKMNQEDKDSIKGVLKQIMPALSDEYIKQTILSINGVTYEEAYEILKKTATDPGLSQKQQRGVLLAIIKNQGRRLKKIIDLANNQAENQKKVERNSTSDVLEMDLNEIDQENKGPIDELILEKEEQVLKELETMTDQRFRAGELIDDENAEIYYQYAARVKKLKQSNASQEQIEQLQKQLEIMKSRIMQAQYNFFYDPLTQAKNYRFLTEVVPDQIRDLDEQNQDYALVSFDIDNLKAFNESWNHKTGDVLIMMISAGAQEAVRNYIRKNRTKVDKIGFEPSVIRATGGEEFILTLPGLSATEAQAVFAKVSKNINKRVRKFIRQQVSEGFQAYDYQNERMEDRIKEFVKEQEVEINGKTVKKSQHELNNIGTITAGIVSLKELRALGDEDNGFNIITKEKDGTEVFNAGKFRAIADSIGEELKNFELSREGTAISRRGEVGRLEAYYLENKNKELSQRMKEADALITRLKQEKQELEKGVDRLHQEVQNLIKQLEKTKKSEDIHKIRRRIKEIEHGRF